MGLADKQAGNYQLHQNLYLKKSNDQLHGERDHAGCQPGQDDSLL